MSLKKIKKILTKLPGEKWFRILVLLLTFYFTFVLRAHNYDRVPEMNHLEEMLYAWSGMYLWTEGVPVSWSTLDYPKRAEVFRGEITYNGGPPIAGVTLYRPWLDEPPLFSLLIGGSDLLFGAKKDQFPPSSFTRFPMMIIAFLTSIMIFILAKKLSGFWTGVLSVLIYGSVPIMVFASRTAVPENLIGLIILVCLYLILRYQEKLRFSYLVSIPLLIGIAGLSKPTGYFILPLVLFFILKEKMYKHTLLIFLLTLPFIGAFFAYGNYYDSEIFARITGLQSYRPVGFSSLAWFFSSPAYYIHIVVESWYVFILLFFAYLVFNPPNDRKRLLVITAVYWVMVVMISGGEQDTLPWYRFPIFPVLAIFGAWGLQMIVSKNNFFTTFLAAGMLLGNRVLLVNAFKPNVSPYTYRIFFSLLMLPSTLYEIFNFKFLLKLNKILIIVIITLGFYLNSAYIYKAFDIACESKTCDIGQSIWLSEAYFPILWKAFDFSTEILK